MTNDPITLPPMPNLQVPMVEGDISMIDVRVLCKWAERVAKSYARAAVLADRAEREKDAMRYRWLRSASVDRGCIPYDDWWECLGDKLDEDFDAAIDAALKEGK